MMELTFYANWEIGRRTMNDQWYFDIGDGNTYGPFPLEKLKKWAASGNLMPTHRVRNAESEEWIIAAYVPGLEVTTAVTDLPPPAPVEEEGKSFGKLVRRLKGKGKDAQAAAEPDIVALCDELLEAAFLRRASDIHIDPEEKIVLVQLRVDGELETLKKLPKAQHSPVVTRFKVMSNMDIAEKRLPQDGRFMVPLGPQQRNVSIRAACLPTTHGERMTLRLLAVETEQLTLNRLGMSKAAYDTFIAHASQKQGMVLLTGPTGSGKSTTLYAALRHRLANYPGRIITVEDPVEYDVVGVAQSEVDAADKLRFDTALRTILRSDPDVIMIGEIRDFETVDIAIKAALTGHLVFSSLHTNSAASVITRLIDMGVLPFLVAATLKLCIAQRLIRRLCPKCRKPRPLTDPEAHILGQPNLAGATVYEPGRCAACNERGFRGRVGLFELLPIDNHLASRIVAGCDEGELIRYMQEHKLTMLRDDAVDKLLTGATSFSEVVAVT
jgi:type II secretory ATPase GspE/PulE/Tfp pilus assembly ATPase PilB-like protein